jgi:hypothetical protein
LENGCWEWQGSRVGVKKGKEAKIGTGHGNFHFEGRNVYAHRFAWEALGGNAPADIKCVCHKCDNPKCVNPEHMFLGSKAENNHDMKAKGRSKGAVGVANKLSKLNDDKVRLIRQLWEMSPPSRPTHAELAEMFHVDRSVICEVINRKIWKHVV